MIVKFVARETTEHHTYPVLRVIGFNGSPIETLSEEKLKSSQFLCQSSNDNVFVSGCAYDSYMGWYVDDVKNKICIPVEKLKEIYIIIK